ncbi:MAG: class I SAM-dependent RNA methyltransferase [Betaproteobacteria bacterium]|nr:class I SAM-dependent RNA methyltransferase [Betaproteobacteria bacterium]
MPQDALAGFAVCPGGLEDALVQELQAMPGLVSVAKGRGGATFSGSAQAIARANIWARTPTRLLVQAGRGRFRTPEEFRDIATKILWENWFTFRQTLRIDLAVGREPNLAKPLARNFATLLVKDGICDRFRVARGERPSIDTTHPDIRVWAFIDQNELTLYLDTSGEPLFKRGWRQSKGEAPLRENLAAALIALTEWNGQSPLMDPFCGSGTLLIEAMQRALRLPPGYLPQSPREFAAEHFHAQSPMGQVNWRALRVEAKEAIEKVIKSMGSQAAGSSGITPPRMQGSDIDPRLVEVAKQNAKRALPEVAAAAITWQAAPFEALTPIAAEGLLATNPPYGKRLEQPGEAAAFERGLGETLKKNFAGWQAWILSDNLKLDSGMRLKASRRVPVFNGDIECRWMRFDMVSGSNRERNKDFS